MPEDLPTAAAAGDRTELRPRRLLGVVLCWGLAASAWAGENLLVDASFESPLPPAFAERQGTSYYAGKQRVEGAHEGRTALVIEGWDRGGSRILSVPIRLAGDEDGPATTGLSATAAVRSFGEAGGATFELALSDEKGQRQLASFGRVALDGKGTWQTVGRAGVTAEDMPETCRLALVPAGPHGKCRLEVDSVGLFRGDALERVVDNSDLSVLEAETLADGAAWKAVDHYPNWYRGTPSGMKMLAGGHGIGAEQNRPLVRRLVVRRGGPHRLWLRLLAGPYAGKFTVALRQNGAVVAEKEFAENDPAYGRKYHWAWDSIPVDLQPGDVELVLTRPAQQASWVTRKLDLLLLTNRQDYVPLVEHFRPQGYLRFTNLSEKQEPFCLWIWVRRHQGPRWYANPGVLSRAGLSEGYYVPGDRSKWLAAGDRSPWVRISDYLLNAGGRNNVQVIATRKMHTDGFVDGRIRGRLEFADAPGGRVLRTIEVDQPAPRILLTLPYDLPGQPDQIKTALDYVGETETVLDALGPAPGSPARWLNLAANLHLEAGVDDPDVLRCEIEILKRLGFNQSYHLLAPPEEALEFHRRHGLLARFGGGPSLWNAVEHGSQHHPDRETMRNRVEAFAEEHAAALDHFVRFKLMDEPSGMSYESLAASAPCGEKFAAWLRDRGLGPAELGVSGWDEVRPVLPDQKAERPELFYYTGLFRLEAFATLARACVEAKQARLPEAMLTYVNYSPPTGGGSWTERGTDLFLAHRDGGMEMIWTEDWLGYGLGPQHLSDTLALCRAAGRAQNRRLGAYCVGQGTPALMRMKLYTLVAGGVRDIECYDYGPWYAGIDSWGRRFDLYPVIRQCDFELGRIDAYLQGTTRRRARLAILYNRTASIWAGRDNSGMFNGSFTHWALAHAGFDADFLAEEDVEAGALDGYKALYLDGRQLRRASARAIADWVRGGGVLFASAGAASRDEFDRPSDLLEGTFAARSHEFQAVAVAGRPKFDLRGLKTLERLQPVAAEDTPATGIDQLCWQERLEPLEDARVILRDRQQRPAGILHAFGRGTAIRLAALPGISYAQEAVQPPYDPDSYLPQKFRAELRALLAWPARLAGVVPGAVADSPIAEIVRYDGPDRAVLVVIDHRGRPVERFGFELDEAAGFQRAITASGSPVEIVPREGGRLGVFLPLNVADAVVLLKGERPAGVDGPPRPGAVH